MFQRKCRISSLARGSAPPKVRGVKKPRRWLAPWKDSPDKPAIYHCCTRVVDRNHVLGDAEREHFRMLLRMYENFTGCRVLTYCLMENHVHILLEVPPPDPAGLGDEAFSNRLRALYSRGRVAEIGRELARARSLSDGGKSAAALVEKYTRRMHDLSHFMRGVLQRFTRWFNRTHERTGTLWEARFKSVIVESGTAARTIAAYIDLNPVRAGLVDDPADYRWSGYGEAAAGGKKARAGLVRAISPDAARDGGARAWAQGGLGKKYRELLLLAAVERRTVHGAAAGATKVTRRGMKAEAVERELAAMDGRGTDFAVSKVIGRRVRYFTDGAVIGSKGFVDEVFRRCRSRFGPKRTSGARKPRGSLRDLAGELWSLRDLRGETG